MATVHGAQNLTIFFCGDPDQSFMSALTCLQTISNAFDSRSVFRHDHSEALKWNGPTSKNERNEISAKLLAIKVHEIYKTFKEMGVKGCRYRFLLFTGGEGARIVKLALEELSEERPDINVYVFGGTVEIPSQLAGRASHYTQESSWDETVLQIAKEETRFTFPQ